MCKTFRAKLSVRKGENSAILQTDNSAECVEPFPFLEHDKYTPKVKMGNKKLMEISHYR